MKKRILLVDDEVSILKVMQLVLGKAGYEVAGCFRPEEAIFRLDNEKFDLMITDLRLNHRLDGLDLIREAKIRDSCLPILMITAYATIKVAVKAMKEGAYDFITKPFKMEELLDSVSNALANHHYSGEEAALGTAAGRHFDNMIGESEEMQKVYELIEKVAKTDATVLIEGESGTGKELVARAIHKISQRSEEPFCAINCSSIANSEMLDHKLFGHTADAPGGSGTERTGLVGSADKGVLYLDGVAGMDNNFQSKMLRVMQNKVIRRVGDDKETPVDIRVIASSNDQLHHKKENGEFREDLYYRLSVIPIKMPPLRRRIQDIPLLAQHFCHKQSETFCREISINEEAIDCMMQYSWPGNVRELENAIACAATLSQNGVICLKDLPPNIVGFNNYDSAEKNLTDGKSLKEFLRQKEKQYLQMVLKKTNGNRVKAAEMLGISRASLYRKLEE